MIVKTIKSICSTHPSVLTSENTDPGGLGHSTGASVLTAHS